MWPKRPETDLKERKKKQIKTFPFTDRANTYLLFDNGQNTYWDGELWEYFFKDDIVLRGRGPFVILFCSYGSPTSRPVHYDCGTPLTLVRCARMTLRADTCHHADHGPIGLLLSRPEFEEVIYRFKGPYCVAVCLDDDLRELLFDWTLGHVGAVVDILSELARQASDTLAPSYNTSESSTEPPRTTRRWNINYQGFLRLATPKKAHEKFPRPSNLFTRITH